MSQDERYLRTRFGLNPHRDARAPYQNEMVQWNDGYDKGYEVAKKEGEAAVHAKEAELMKQIWALRNENTHLVEANARLQNLPNKTGQ